MSIYLVQHGLSLSRDIDPERKLSENGKAHVQRIAIVAKNYGIHVAGIKHSGKKRAEQTAEIFASELNPQNGIERISGLNPNDDVTVFAGNFIPSSDLMLVGHLPFMEKLTSFLTTSNPENIVFKFQNGGIVCLDKALESDRWFIKWTLMPKIT